MQPSVKKFIEEHIDEINDNQFEDVLSTAAAVIFETHLMYELVVVLETVAGDLTETRWKIFDQLVKDYIDNNLNAPAWTKDKSNSWARVDYMLEEICDMGFGWPDAKDHVIHNGNKYGTVVRKLAPEYGWMGEGDYAFKWFDSVAFDKEYKYE